MSEASLWDYLRQILPRKGHYSRIESETSQGFPDIHYTLLGLSGSIELKFAHSPKKYQPFSGRDEGLRRSQIDWMRDENSSGGLIWIIAEIDKQIHVVSGNDFFEEFNWLNLDQFQRLSALSWIRGRGYPGNALEACLSTPLDRVKKAK